MSFALPAGFFRGEEFVDGFQILGLKTGDRVFGSVGIPVIQIGDNLFQRVGGAGHGRQDHQIATGLRDQSGNGLNPCSGTYGSSAKFHYFHLVKFVRTTKIANTWNILQNYLPDEGRLILVCDFGKVPSR